MLYNGPIVPPEKEETLVSGKRTRIWLTVQKTGVLDNTRTLLPRRRGSFEIARPIFDENVRPAI